MNITKHVVVSSLPLSFRIIARDHDLSLLNRG